MSDRTAKGKDWIRAALEIRAAAIQGFGAQESARKFGKEPSKVYPFTPFHYGFEVRDFWRGPLLALAKQALPTDATRTNPALVFDAFGMPALDAWEEIARVTKASGFLRAARELRGMSETLHSASAVVNAQGVACFNPEASAAFWDKQVRLAIEVSGIEASEPVGFDQFWSIAIHDAPENLKAAAAAAAELAGNIAREAGEIAGSAARGLAIGLGIPAIAAIVVGGVVLHKYV